MTRVSKQLTELKQHTDDHCKDIEQLAEHVAGHDTRLADHDDAVGYAQTALTNQREQLDGLDALVRGGEYGPGLSGEVRELKAQLSAVLKVLGMKWVPEHQVAGYLESTEASAS